MDGEENDEANSSKKANLTFNHLLILYASDNNLLTVIRPVIFL